MKNPAISILERYGPIKTGTLDVTKEAIVAQKILENLEKFTVADNIDEGTGYKEAV